MGVAGYLVYFFKDRGVDLWLVWLRRIQIPNKARTGCLSRYGLQGIDELRAKLSLSMHACIDV
jgi:hypothetical protein